MTKAELHRIVDELPDEALEVAARLLERAAQDPTAGLLDTAPWDDEPVSPEEDAEVRAALQEPGIPLKQVRKELLG